MEPTTPSGAVTSAAGLAAHAPSLEDRVHQRSLAHVVNQSRLGLVTLILLASALGTMFVPTSGWRMYLIWWALTVGGFVLRQIWFERLRREIGQQAKWRLMLVNLASAATSWLVMLALPVFGPRLHESQFMVLVGLFLTYITAGVSLLAVQPTAHLIYLAACSATIMFAMWQRYGFEDQIAMTLAIPLGGVMLYRLALSIQGLVREAVREAMLNEKMATQLQLALADSRAAFESRSRFLASASHDLKQPVHALSLLISVLQRTQNENRRREVVREIDQATRSIDTMFSSLMDMARIDAGSLEAHLTGIELLPLLKSTLAGFPDACAQKGLHFSLRVEGSPVVHADPLLLQRVLSNLLDNALKFTVEGQIGVDVVESDGSVSISVLDTGVGISPEEQKSMFEPFARGHQAQTLGIAGLGLGLAVVQHMADLMHMHLSVQSRPGDGSTFSLRMEKGTMRDLVQLDDQVNASLKGQCVWLVEDDRIAREATQHWLEECGATVVAMRSAIEAQENSATGERPDLLIADHNLGLGDMSGAMLVAWAQQRYPGLRCIVVTGESSVSLEHADAVLLRKPLSAISLTKALQAVTGA